MTSESQADFARRLGMARSYITQLKQDGRLVMDATGKRVEVEASLALIEATESPAPRHTARASTHAEARARRDRSEAGSEAGQQEPPAAPSDYQELAAIGLRLKRAEADKREHEAEIARLEREKMAGNLLDREVVDFVLSDLGALVRSILENRAARLAPVLVPIQALDEMHAALEDEDENILVELHAALGRAAERYERA